MEKMKDCPWRIGLTGTVGSKTIHKLVLQGLFGKSKKFISTKNLMDRKEIATLKIECINLKYTDNERESLKKTTYKDEIKYITEHTRRNNFISGLALAQKKNVLILIQKIKHGETLEKLIRKKANDRNVYLVNGGTDKKDREIIRKIVEKETGSIIIASYGVFSRGVSIKNIHHVIFGSPSKSEFRVLQSIGRGLRVSSTKSKVKLYDIVDDLSWKNRKNYALKHFIERVKLYVKEQFVYEIRGFKI